MSASIAPSMPESTAKQKPGWPPGLVLAPVAIVTICLIWEVWLASAGQWRSIAVLPIGLGIGATLLLTNFGFASAFRQAATARDFGTFRAHALMIGLATSMMTPILAGTLFLLGGGNLKFLAVLAAFVLGSTVGAAHAGFWHALPAIAPATIRSIGPWPVGLAAELAGLGFVWWRLPSKQPLPRRLIFGAIGLAVLNTATLVVAGRPWSETYGFALWGSKLAASLGFDPASWEFWEGGVALDHSIFADVTSIMDMSIVLGALAAAAARNRFDLKLGGSWRSWLSAVLGGVLMGYAARMADGCNIGAYFSAIASGSFSGYVWAAGALGGSGVGVWIRHKMVGSEAS